MFLKKEQRQKLLKLHKQERVRRADRIKAILLSDEGCSHADIARHLLLDVGTVRAYVKDYQESEKLDPNHKGKQSKLNPQQTQELVEHLTENTYSRVKDIRQHIQTKYGVAYSEQGMTDWMHNHDFCYKKAKGIPAKADEEKQKAFIETYNKELKDKPSDEPVVFMDAVHPTMATKLSHVWVRKGTEKQIKTVASRTRMNITGAVNIKSLKLVSKSYDRIDGESIVSFLKELEEAYPGARYIHVILDQGPYHRSQKVTEYLPTSRIKLHFLPAYSPNLNPIERLWRIMNQRVRNNRYFATAQEFRDRITEFLEVSWSQMAYEMRSCITDNFQVLKTANSS